MKDMKKSGFFTTWKSWRDASRDDLPKSKNPLFFMTFMASW